MRVSVAASPMRSSNRLDGTLNAIWPKKRTEVTIANAASFICISDIDCSSP
jgi:hypothetical protein